MPVYIGPAHRILWPDEGGKEYHPGDNIPLNKAQVADLVARGHLFEGVDQPEVDATPPATGSLVQQPPDDSTKESEARRRRD